MNFGERLKQIRTEKGLTQPQFAAMAGIEQSYLSKLENDKSVPSAEMFSSILSGLGLDVESRSRPGSVYSERVGNGHRVFVLMNTESVQAPGNRSMQYLGAIVLFSGCVGLFNEWRLRRLKNRRR